MFMALLGSQMTATGAAFSAETRADATFSADVLQPPTNVRVSHTCTELLGQLLDFYVDVAWDPSASAYATSVALWRATDSAGPYTAIYVGSANTFRDTALAPSTTYYYVVTADYANWTSVHSQKTSVQTKSDVCL